MVTKIMSGFRDRLEREVNRLGVTAISNQLGVARNTVYNWLAKGNVPLNYLMALEGMGANLHYICFGETVENQGLSTDEQLLLDAYRDLPAAKRKELLASMLVGAATKKTKRNPPVNESGIRVTGSGNRVAGRDYKEGK